MHTEKEGDRWIDVVRESGEVDLDERSISGLRMTTSELDGWGFVVDVAADGRVTRLEISAQDVTARGLRSVPVAQMARAAAVRAKNIMASFSLGYPITTMDDVEFLNEIVEISGSFGKRPGRRGRSDYEYARLAKRYVDLCDETATPLNVLKEEEGYSASQLRNFLGAARGRGLLGPAPRGRAGGELTPKAREILKTEKEV